MKNRILQRRSKLSALACAALLGLGSTQLGAGPKDEADRAAMAPQEQPPLDIATLAWADAAQAQRLTGQPVLDDQGDRLGTVQEVVRDDDTLELALVIEREGDDTNDSAETVVIPFEDVDLAVQMPREELTELPAYEEDQYQAVAEADTEVAEATPTEDGGE